MNGYRTRFAFGDPWKCSPRIFGAALANEMMFEKKMITATEFVESFDNLRREHAMIEYSEEYGPLCRTPR